MKLSKAQLVYITERRKKLEQRENDIRSIGDDIYKSQTLCRELTEISMERRFFHHMIKLHNVEVQAEKALEGSVTLS